MYSLIDKISDLLNTVISDTINTLNTTVTNGFNKGSVKSVQRGKYSASSGEKSTTITISSVNTSKSIILINGDASYSSDVAHQLMVSSFSSTSFKIEGQGYLDSFSWQVIEFY